MARIEIFDTNCCSIGYQPACGQHNTVTVVEDTFLSSDEQLLSCYQGVFAATCESPLRTAHLKALRAIYALGEKDSKNLSTPKPYRTWEEERADVIARCQTYIDQYEASANDKMLGNSALSQYRAAADALKRFCDSIQKGYHEGTTKIDAHLTTKVPVEKSIQTLNVGDWVFDSESKVITEVFSYEEITELWRVTRHYVRDSRHVECKLRTQHICTPTARLMTLNEINLFLASGLRPNIQITESDMRTRLLNAGWRLHGFPKMWFNPADFHKKTKNPDHIPLYKNTSDAYHAFRNETLVQRNSLNDPQLGDWFENKEYYFRICNDDENDSSYICIVRLTKEFVNIFTNMSEVENALSYMIFERKSIAFWKRFLDEEQLQACEAPKVDNQQSKLTCGCHCKGGCGDPYAACMYPCEEHIPY